MRRRHRNLSCNDRGNLINYPEFILEARKEYSRLKRRTFGEFAVVIIINRSGKFARSIVDEIHSSLRFYDLVTVFQDGEKIGILLPDTSVSRAENAIQRISKKIVLENVEFRFREVRVSQNLKQFRTRSSGE